MQRQEKCLCWLSNTCSAVRVWQTNHSNTLATKSVQRLSRSHCFRGLSSHFKTGNRFYLCVMSESVNSFFLKIFKNFISNTISAYAKGQSFLVSFFLSKHDSWYDWATTGLVLKHYNNTRTAQTQETSSRCFSDLRRFVINATQRVHGFHAIISSGKALNNEILTEWSLAPNAEIVKIIPYTYKTKQNLQGLYLFVYDFTGWCAPDHCENYLYAARGARPKFTFFGRRVIGRP